MLSGVLHDDVAAASGPILEAANPGLAGCRDGNGELQDVGFHFKLSLKPPSFAVVPVSSRTTTFVRLSLENDDVFSGRWSRALCRKVRGGAEGNRTPDLCSDLPRRGI